VLRALARLMAALALLVERVAALRVRALGSGGDKNREKSRGKHRETRGFRDAPHSAAGVGNVRT
jgi:hypothetical protein